METQEEMELLRSWNVDMIQGYYFSRPLPPGDLLRLLTEEAVEQMVFACTALLAASLSACGSKPAENTDTGTASSAAASSSSSEQQQENTLTGSLDEKKNGMFVVTDAEGAAYEFTYDPSDTPKGLDDAAEGDSVTVTYTGTVSEVDSFDGTVVSVEKAEAAQN